MSSPWKFFGTWLPFMEGVYSGATGLGTLYPLLWGRTDGATTSDQICAFEWTTKAVGYSFSGSGTCTFANPTPGGMPPTAQASASYSISGSVLDTNGTTGTDWSVLEPSDIVAGGRWWIVSGTQTVPVTLPWPSTGEAIVFNVQVDVGKGFNTNAIAGTGFTQYGKELRIAVSANGALTSSTVSDFITPSFQNTVTVLHGNVSLYAESTATDTVSVSGSLSVATTFSQPPNI